MAITVPAFTITMTDAEFLLLNGRAATAPNEGAGLFPTNSVFYGVLRNANTSVGQVDPPASALTAASTTGTTTVTLSAGFRTDYHIRVLMQRIRRAAVTLGITFTA